MVFVIIFIGINKWYGYFVIYFEFRYVFINSFNNICKFVIWYMGKYYICVMFLLVVLVILVYICCFYMNNNVMIVWCRVSYLLNCWMLRKLFYEDGFYGELYF